MKPVKKSVKKPSTKIKKTKAVTSKAKRMKKSPPVVHAAEALPDFAGLVLTTSDEACPCPICTGTNRPLIELDQKVRVALQATESTDAALEIADYLMTIGERLLSVVTNDPDVEVVALPPQMRELFNAVFHHAAQTNQSFDVVAQMLMGRLIQPKTAPTLFN